jgi:carbon storage regulator CsrA
MLVLSRKLQQEIMIGENVKVTVLKVKGNTVRLGIEAPRNVRVVRGELAPAEEPMVEVTVVFDDKSIESRKHVARIISGEDVVPFRTVPAEKPASEPRAMTTEAGAPTISYQSRLPKALQHDRLKQIVTELTTRKE